MNISEEIFEGRECDYDIIEKNDDRVLIKFKSKSLIEYRFDILREPNTRIWHLAFSLSSSDMSDGYHDRTNKYESIDIISRMVWILNDLELNVDEYCIGITGDKSKDNIYTYMMRSAKEWDKRETNQYPLGWAIYFKI
jgi:hypothetical protein